MLKEARSQKSTESLGARLFALTDYKEFLREVIEENSGVPGYKSRIAEAMNAPSSFVSQVLHSKAHLSQDQAFRLAKYWELKEDERAYFLELIDLARAGSSELREYRKRRLDQMRKEKADFGGRLERPYLESEEALWLYYTNWQYSAIHMALTLPGFTKPEKIARRMELLVQDVSLVLADLEKMGLAKKSGNEWKATEQNIHLPRTSKALPAYHRVWRERAVLSAHRGYSENSTHFTGQFTLSRADFDRMRLMLLDFIEKSRSIAVASKNEDDVVCVTCDLFRL